VPTSPDAASTRAAVDADHAADRAGIRIEPVQTVRQADDAADILRTIWSAAEVGERALTDTARPAAATVRPVAPDPTALPGNTIRALAHAGNYAVSVRDDRAGAQKNPTLAPIRAPARRALHSHITGLLPAARGRSIGTAVKLHQRAWALAHGLTTVTWTYDPLIARNAHFNLSTLGAVPTHYEVDFYGSMADGINDGDETDRFAVDWDLTRPWPPDPSTGEGDLLLAVGTAGEPLNRAAPAADGPVEVAIPHDIELARRNDPELGRAWRAALRDTLLPLLNRGYLVAGFTADAHYLLRPAHTRE